MLAESVRNAAFDFDGFGEGCEQGLRDHGPRDRRFQSLPIGCGTRLRRFALQCRGGPRWALAPYDRAFGVACRPSKWIVRHSYGSPLISGPTFGALLWLINRAFVAAQNEANWIGLPLLLRIGRHNQNRKRADSARCRAWTCALCTVPNAALVLAPVTKFRVSEAFGLLGLK